MTDHVRTLRKRLERMERAEAQNSGRPVNRRDQALADALRAAIKVMDSPRITNATIHVEGKEIRGNLDFASTPAPRVVESGVVFGEVEHDENMGRDYIPFGGGWEIQTKGKGSTFRLVWAEPGNPENYLRWAVLDEHLHEPLTRMAREVRAQIEFPRVPAKDLAIPLPVTDHINVFDVEPVPQEIVDHYDNVYYGHYVTFGDGLTTHGYDLGDDAGIVYTPEDVGYEAPLPPQCEHEWRPVPDMGGMVDECHKCGEERA